MWFIVFTIFVTTVLMLVLGAIARLGFWSQVFAAIKLRIGQLWAAAGALIGKLRGKA